MRANEREGDVRVVKQENLLGKHRWAVQGIAYIPGTYRVEWVVVSNHKTQRAAERRAQRLRAQIWRTL